MHPTLSVCGSDVALMVAHGFSFAVENGRCYLRREADRLKIAAIQPIEVFLLSMQSREMTDKRLGCHGATALEHLRARLGPLIDDSCGEPQELPDPATLGSHHDAAMRWLPGPRILHWSVTHKCPRRCAYCFAEPVHGSAADDSTLERARLAELLAEARSLGAAGILLSGSEPLLREDLPEIIGDARRVGLEVLLTTKHPVDRRLAERLACAGLTSLALSVDTMDPDLSRSLIGSASYPSQVVRTVANLKAAGLGFSIQGVLTPATVATIDGLLGFARDAEALAVQLVPFERVRKPIMPLDQTDLEFGPRDAALLIRDLKLRYPELALTLFEKSSHEACAGSHCDIGATKLFFTPAGRVHRCYKLTDDNSLLGPDLNQVGIAEAWHGKAFGEMLLPPDEQYSSTPCGSCGGFRMCHRSGRCIFEASTKFGRYAAPDRDCDRSRGWAENLKPVESNYHMDRSETGQPQEYLE